LLYRFGERFESGKIGLGQSCRTLTDAVAYLTEHGNAPDEIELWLTQIRKTRIAR
jgi:hypothetical protein